MATVYLEPEEDFFAVDLDLEEDVVGFFVLDELLVVVFGFELVVVELLPLKAYGFGGGSGAGGVWYEGWLAPGWIAPPWPG